MYACRNSGHTLGSAVCMQNWEWTAFRNEMVEEINAHTEAMNDIKRNR